MAAKFNELYHLLEVTKLQLNWCLERMHEVMTDKSLGGSKDNFRSVLLGQIEDTIKPPPLPRVLLNRTKILRFWRCSSNVGSENEMDIDEPVNSPCPSLELSISTVSPVRSPKVRMEHDDDDDVKIKEETVHSENNNAPEQDLKRIRKYRKRKKIQTDYIASLQLKCSFCRATFNNREKCGERLLHQHVARYHCDQLFPNHRLGNIKVAEFKKILGTLLWRDMINENGDTDCCYCDKRFSTPVNKDRNRKGWFASLVKGHYIQAHYEEIEDKLRIFQKRPNLFKMMKQCESNSRICDCGAYLETVSSRVSHSKWHCPLTQKDKQVSGKPKSLPSHGRHEATIIANFYKPKDSNSTATLVCKSCKETFATRRNAVRHWKYTCRKGKRLEIPEKNSRTMGCEYCSYQCVDRMWNSKCRMKVHHVRKHLEHFFKEERNTIESNSWKKKNFKEILVNILFPKFFSCEGKINTKCSLCGVNSNRYVVKVHLINKHMDELKHKLKAILDESNQSLEEQLERSHGNVREMDEDGRNFLEGSKPKPNSDIDSDCDSN